MIELFKYLDDYIFKELGGFYSPGWNVDFNLNNSDLDNKKYIGTYFPRSLIESYVIFEELYLNNVIKSVIDNKKELKILDVGTGTGGNIIGIMHFLKNIGFNKRVVFITFEGNRNAIDYQIKFFKKFNKHFNTNFKLKFANVSFNTNSINLHLSKILSKLAHKYDIITSSKFISEFYNTDYNKAKGLYKSLSETLSEFLSDDGLLVLLDLVSGDYNYTRPFSTLIMSEELNNMVNDKDSKLSFVLPICCGLWSSACKTKICYTERQFEIKHSKTIKNDVSKITYRVMARKSFALEVLSSVEVRDIYQMSYNSKHPRCCNKTNIIDDTNNSSVRNAFKLS